MDKRDLIIKKLTKIAEMQNKALRKLAQEANSTESKNVKDEVSMILKQILGGEFVQLVTAADAVINGVRSITISLGTTLAKDKENLVKAEVGKHFSVPPTQVNALNAFHT